jgi:hypothetical protein
MFHMDEVESNLKVPVFLFTLLLFFQMITGLMLFDLHLGWSRNSILEFYKLKEVGQIGMSWGTFVQTAAPHLLSMALISFLIVHFLTFVENVPFAWRWGFSLALLSFTLIDIFAGVLILYISPDLYWVKILGFVGFQFFFFCCTLMMLSSFWSALQLQSKN